MAELGAVALEGNVFLEESPFLNSSSTSSGGKSGSTWGVPLSRFFFRRRIHFLNTCMEWTKAFVTQRFRKYGIFVGMHPLPFLLVPALILGGLSLGMMELESDSDIEHIYFPVNSRAQKERAIVREVFPDLSFSSFNRFSQSDPDVALWLLFVAHTDNVLDTLALREIRGIVNQVREIKFISEGAFSKVIYGCAREGPYCVIDGEFALRLEFLDEVEDGNVTYPFWTDSNGRERDVSTALSGVKTVSGVLKTAKVIRVSFKMASITNDGQKRFKDFVEMLHPRHSRMSYAIPSSLTQEVDASSKGDTAFFVGTLMLCFIFSVMVSAGGNPVSTRCLLAVAAITSTALSITGCFGFLALAGVKYVNIVGILPFLILGIGIDDMFILMSSWSDTLGDPGLTVPERLGVCFSNAGVAITITTFTDFLAFAIGTSSIFRGVTYFSFYAGLAVLFCYLANATMFAASLSFHGRRVYAGRHFLTCQHVQAKEEMMSQGRHPFTVFFCSGSTPHERWGDSSICERLPNIIIPRIISTRVNCLVVLFCFLVYIGVAIYGVNNLKQGLLLQDLVLTTSYYYAYLQDVFKYFPDSLPIGFIVNGAIDYTDGEGDEFLRLMEQARDDPMVISSFSRCWLTSYETSGFYDPDTPEDFVFNLQTYLNDSVEFNADVVIDNSSGLVTASRCFILSEQSNDQYAMAGLMARLRVIADNSSLPVFVYHSSFTAFDQFLAILPATFKLLGTAIGCMIGVTALFLPHILMIFLVASTIVMILVGIFGFMYFWDITLSPITMIHLVMCVGFSVDFSAHVCAAFLLSDNDERHLRAVDAVRHAASPVLNGAMSTLLGVMLLAFSKSYVFVTFFRIMVLVMTLGLLHGVLFLPSVLALIGPQNTVEKVWEEYESSGQVGDQEEDESTLPKSETNTGTTETNE